MVNARSDCNCVTFDHEIYFRFFFQFSLAATFGCLDLAISFFVDLIRVSR